MDKQSTKNDDHVLFCAMHLQRQLLEREQATTAVVLLTEDHFLRVKANNNGLAGMGIATCPQDLRKVQHFGGSAATDNTPARQQCHLVSS